MAKLCLLNPDGVVDKQWEIGEKPLIVGRGETVDVKIDDDGLSRRHFMVFREGADYLIKDLSSRNGTWLDGQRAAQINLRHEDRIVAGRTQFRFCEQDPHSPQRLIGPNDTVIISQSE
jgi:pSer/pThr/pTyr-binding forkhead associated (FHA) protein